MAHWGAAYKQITTSGHNTFSPASQALADIQVLWLNRGRRRAVLSYGSWLAESVIEPLKPQVSGDVHLSETLKCVNVDLFRHIFKIHIRPPSHLWYTSKTNVVYVVVHV